MKSQEWSDKLFKTNIVNPKLISVGILGIVLILVGSLLNRPVEDTKPPIQLSNIAKVEKTTLARGYEEILEAKLENLLSQVKGAGAVAVNITLENSGYQEHARNVTKESKVTQEKDTSGGIRTTTESKESEQVLLSKENGVDHPVLVRETKPLIKGVLVIAEGAYDSTVKANLTKAVEHGLGMPSYKITVLPQRR